MRKSPFVTVEGVDGSGKSSHVESIIRHLEKEGWEVVSVREPGGTPLGEKIREILLHDEMSVRAEILLAFASREHLLETVIRPALDRNCAVVCDRFTDSTYAYQGGGRGGPVEMIRRLEEQLHGDLQPDLTFIFDLPVEVSKKRLSGTGKKPDKFESQSNEYFEAVRSAYLARAAGSSRFRIIDSSQPMAAVEKAVSEQMGQWKEGVSTEDENRNAVQKKAPQARG